MTATPGGAAGIFAHGVAAGEPTRNGLVLWTRVTGPGDVDLRWEISAADGMSGPDGEGEDPRSGVVTARRGTDHTVTVGVGDLRAGRRYRYRFTTADGRHASPWGTARTVPDAAQSYRVGVACCADRTVDDLDAYRWFADQRPDVVVHLGDYVYEHGRRGPAGDHDPPREAVSLDDYRRRYRQYRRDRALQEAHAAAAWICLWDDHEFADDAFRGGADRRRRHGTGWSARRDAARRAFDEWLPVSAGDTHRPAPSPLDRSVTVGDLVRLICVDTRMGGRELQSSEDPVTRRPPEGPRLLSEEQWNWLREQLEPSAPTASTILFSQVQFSPLRLGFVPDLRRRPHLRPLVNPDQWDGYPAERRRLAGMLVRQPRPLVVSGDLHGTFVTGCDTDGKRIPELTVPAIASTPFLDVATASPAALRHLVAAPPVRHLARRGLGAWLRMLNPWLRRVDTVRHGAAVIEVTPQVTTATIHRRRTTPVVVEASAGGFVVPERGNRVRDPDNPRKDSKHGTSRAGEPDES